MRNNAIIDYPNKNNEVVQNLISETERKLSKKKVVKFDLNDVISSVVLNLVGNLNRDVLDSNLTEFIEEYCDTVNDIMQEDPYKYIDITTEIKECLEYHGWKIGHGFQRQPKRLALVADLELITSSYF